MGAADSDRGTFSSRSATRPRDPAVVRRDALVFAVKKGMEGCAECARGYFALARARGATDEEIRQAIARSTPSGISRRGLVKMAFAASVAVTASELSAIVAQASTPYWGTDSNGATCCGIPQNFYIGRFGYGMTAR